MIVIHDDNWAEFAEVIHEEAPQLCGALPRQSKIGSLPYARPYTEVIDLIPPSKYAEYYEAMKGKFIRQRYEQYNPALQNQRDHPSCWRTSLAQHLECVRAKQGLPYRQLASESIAGVYNYRDVGGMLDEALAYTTIHGMAPRSMIPEYSFNPKTYAPGWEQAALDVVPLEKFDLGTKDMEAEVMTALFEGDAVYIGLNWLGHAMNYEEIQYTGKEYGLWTPNTWGAGQDMLILGKHKIPDEAFVVRAVTYSR